MKRQPSPRWLTVADYARAHLPSRATEKRRVAMRKFLYDCIKRGEFDGNNGTPSVEFFRLTEQGHYEIRADAPLPPKRRAGRRAESRGNGRDADYTRLN